jgi:Single Cache domain 2
MHRNLIVVLCAAILLEFSSTSQANPTSEEMLEVKNQVNGAYKILEKYGEKARKGQISTDKAQELAKKEISKLR